MFSLASMPCYQILHARVRQVYVLDLALAYHTLRLLTLSQLSFHKTKILNAAYAITEICFAPLFGSVRNSGVCDSEHI